MLKKIKSILNKREFAKNAMTILTGSSLAQVIPILVAPIISRIFTPGEFGILAVYLGVVTILSSISTGRYEFALVLPEKKEDSIHLFFAGFIILCLTTSLSILLLLLFKDRIIDIFKIERISRWIYFIPLSAFLLGMNNLLNYYNIRLKKFKIVATTTIAKSTVRSLGQLSSGAIHTGASGLVISEILAFLAGNLSQSRPILKDIKQQNIRLAEIKKQAKLYKRFPLISMWAVFFNTASQNVHHFFISGLFSLSQTGLYSYAIKYISIPINMMGNALGQVLIQSASESRRQTGKADKSFKAIFIKLFLIGLPSFTILYFVIEDIFAWYLGEEWRMAGVYAKILMPYLFTRFIAMPLSVLNSVFEKQWLSLYWQSGLFILTVSIFLIVKNNDYDMSTYLHILSITHTVYYSFLILLLFFVAKGKLNKYNWL